MKGQKRPKLSLKRKQSILPCPGEVDTNTASKNSVTSNKTPVVAKGNSPKQIPFVNTAHGKDDDGLQIVISISDSDGESDDKPLRKKDRYLSDPEEQCKNPIDNNQTVVSRCGFLNVEDQDLKTLRESFLKHRSNKPVDIRSLTDLPMFQVANGNSNSSESLKDSNDKNVFTIGDNSKYLNVSNNDNLKNIHSLTLLPPLCKWCQHRKPVPLQEQYPYKSFWNFDENLPGDNLSVFNRSCSNDLVRKTEDSTNSEKTENNICNKEICKLNKENSNIENSIKSQPLFRDSKNFLTENSNSTNFTEKMDVSLHSNCGRVVAHVNNKFQIQESVNEIINQKDANTYKSYDAKRNTSNPEIGRNFITKQNMEKTNDHEPERKSVYFAGSRNEHSKILKSADGIGMPEFAGKIADDSSNDRTLNGDDNISDHDKLNCDIKESDNNNILDGDQSSKIESCPLCQTKFEKRMKQIDKDGHIAACFAASSDDVTW